MRKVIYGLLLFSFLYGCNDAIPKEKKLVSPNNVELKREFPIVTQVDIKKKNQDKCLWENIHEYSRILDCINVLEIDRSQDIPVVKALEKISSRSEKNIPYGSIEEYRLKNVDFDQGRLILVALDKTDGSYILSNKKRPLSLDGDDVEITHEVKNSENKQILNEVFTLYFNGGVTTLSLEKNTDELIIKRELSAD